MDDKDTPLAQVNNGFGPSEIVVYIMAIAGLLTAYTGNDHGLTKNAQAIALIVAGAVVVGNSIARAIKHRGAMLANATVYKAQLEAKTAVALAPPPPAPAVETVAEPKPPALAPPASRARRVQQAKS